MKTRVFCLVVTCFLMRVTHPLLGHDVITTKITWTQEISRIIQKRCIACHPAGSAVPLSSYEEARPWATAIRDQVLSRKMPPWGAVSGVGEFRNDPSLTALEIELFTHWVEGGAPRGDEIYLPKTTIPNAAVKGKTCAASISLRAGSRSVRGHFEGLQPAGLPAGGSMEAWAELPNGEVRRLIWIRDFPPRSQTPYFFREPVDLPAGSRLFVDAPPGAKILLCR